MVYKFAVIGGDTRNIFLAKNLRDDGAIVNLYGVENYTGYKLKESKSLEEALLDVHFVIGSIPCSNDAENLNTPFSDETIPMSTIFDTMSEDQVFFAGRISESLLELAGKYQIKTHDLLEREDMAILNAIPSAEGAIKIAIEETNFTLHSSKILVIGYGRIGKILCRILNGFAADVHVAVHKPEQFAEVKSHGYTPILTEHMGAILKDTNIIINTVPKVLLNRNNLYLIKKDCFILDLASKPFGIDYECSKKFGLKVLWAPSLPGKIAPQTVAEYMKQTIYAIISEEE